jgi:outer membrane protein insertion porin family
VNLSYDNPYWNDDGVSRGFYGRYQDYNYQQANISTYTSTEWAVGMNFGIPVTEVDYLRSGFGFRSSQLNIGTRECFDRDPETGFCYDVGYRPTAFDPLSHSLDFNGDNILEAKEREFQIIDWTVSWTRDSRNHFLNPSRGSAQTLSLQIALPGSTREYYKFVYRGAKYWPIWGGMVFAIRGNLGYGNAYDSYDKESQASPILIDQPVSGTCDPTDLMKLDTNLPFYEHFYSGGVRDLRGYDDNTLGPKDGYCRAVGGDLKVGGGMEIAFPTPFVGAQSGTRIAFFVDTGYVYATAKDFDAAKLRGSYGISVTWEAPVGPIVVSYAFPFNDREGDRLEDLQFSFGTTF